MANKSTSKQPQDTGSGDSMMPLFYSNPVPLDAKVHAKLGLRKNFGFGFAEKVNAVPINLIEMPQISHSYPIAFSPDASATPVAILGLRDNENLFVDDKGQWLEDTYIPAYVRRYPFIFSEIPGAEQLTLCVDYDKKIVEDGSEQAFFEADGKATALSQNALEFCKSYHAAAQQTLEFSKFLGSSGLLTGREVQINVPGNKRINFSGFHIVDEAKLSGLSDSDFLEWRRKGWLPFLYAHLFSGMQWNRLASLLAKRMGDKA